MVAEDHLQQLQSLGFIFIGRPIFRFYSILNSSQYYLHYFCFHPRLFEVNVSQFFNRAQFQLRKKRRTPVPLCQTTSPKLSIRTLMCESTKHIKPPSLHILFTIQVLYTRVNKCIRLFPKLPGNIRLILKAKIDHTPKTATPLWQHVYMTANEQCAWQVRRTRKLDEGHDLRMVLCLFEAVVRGHHS